ncbi:MAG: glycosyltransferase family 2 protein, partial [bacterium]
RPILAGDACQAETRKIQYHWLAIRQKTFKSKFYPEVTLITNNSNRGFSVACNQGLYASSGRYALILNPDTMIPPLALTSFIKFMEEHEAAGAAGPRLADKGGRFLPESKRGIPMPAAAFFRFSQIFRFFPQSGFINRYYMGHIDENETAVVEAVTGAFLFMRREAAEKAGFFDERYFLFGEDIDICMQISAAGYEVWYYPEVTVTHFKGRSGSMTTYRGITNFYRSMHLFIEKNLRRKYIFPLRALFHAGVFIAFLLSAVLRAPAVAVRNMNR